MVTTLLFSLWDILIIFSNYKLIKYPMGSIYFNVFDVFYKGVIPGWPQQSILLSPEIWEAQSGHLVGSQVVEVRKIYSNPIFC